MWFSWLFSTHSTTSPHATPTSTSQSSIPLHKADALRPINHLTSPPKTDEASTSSPSIAEPKALPDDPPKSPLFLLEDVCEQLENLEPRPTIIVPVQGPEWSIINTVTGLDLLCTVAGNKTHQAFPTDPSSLQVYLDTDDHHDQEVKPQGKGKDSQQGVYGERSDDADDEAEEEHEAVEESEHKDVSLLELRQAGEKVDRWKRRLEASKKKDDLDEKVDEEEVIVPSERPSKKKKTAETIAPVLQKEKKPTTAMTSKNVNRMWKPRSPINTTTPITAKTPQNSRSNKSKGPATVPKQNSSPYRVDTWRPKTRAATVKREV